MDEENKLFTTEEEQSLNQKQELLDIQDKEESINLKKNILSLFSKFQEGISLQRDLEKVLDDSLLRDIRDQNPDFTPLCKLKLKEILSKYDSDTFMNLTRMVTDILKFGLDLNKDDKQQPLTKDQIQDMQELYQFLKSFKQKS